MDRQRSNGRTVGILLAAGRSARFGSVNKLTYPLEGQPLVLYALRNLKSAKLNAITAVVGHERKSVMSCLGQDLDFAIQEQQLGTGHAVSAALPRVADEDDVVILFGDCPFIDSSLILETMATHREVGSSVTIATTVLRDPLALGRLERDADGVVAKIKEGDRFALRNPAEVFAGLSVWRGSDLRWVLPLLPQKEKKSGAIEQDLPDAVEILYDQGFSVSAHEINALDATAPNEMDEFYAASDYLRRKTKHELITSGVTIRDPARVRVDHTARVEPSAILHSDTQVLGLTQIEGGSSIGPEATLKDCTVGRNCTVGRGFWEGLNFPDGSIASDRLSRTNRYFRRNSHLIAEESDFCFALTPFSDPHLARFQAVVKPTVERLGYRCEIVSDASADGAISEEIWENINRATFLVAELSEKNPNVWWELGVAHALNKPVCMLREEGAGPLPFDVNHLRAHFYSHEKADIGAVVERYVSKNFPLS